MPAPDVTEVKAYLTSTGITAADDDIDDAYQAELDAQAAICDMPADGAAWPANLANALKRRVAVNLIVKSLPLGVQASMTEAAVGITRVGGGDREVDRLEGPFRTIAIA